MSRKNPKKNARPLSRPIPCGSCRWPTPGSGPGAGITLIKLSRHTEAPLSGAEFRIIQNGRIVATATSDINGQIRFPALAPGAYQLWEVKAPTGHIVSGGGLGLVVASDGRVIAEGATANTITLYNTPISAEPLAPAPIGENIAETAEKPAPQAVPLEPTGENSAAVTEEPAADTLPEPPARCAAPGIDPVRAGAMAITGSGFDGSRVTLRFSGGKEASTSVFGGQWYIFVPAGVTLSPGDRFEAVAARGSALSEPTAAIVT